MLTAEQRREILAVALLAVALFVLLALLPVAVFGARSVEWFPSGNMMGMVGGTLHGLLTAFLGVTAFLVPVLVALAGLHLGGWIAPGFVLRGAVLGAGMLLLLPTTVWVFTSGPVASGWLGRAHEHPTAGRPAERRPEQDERRPAKPSPSMDDDPFPDPNTQLDELGRADPGREAPDVQRRERARRAHDRARWSPSSR
jgi:hypothetical protein